MEWYVDLRSNIIVTVLYFFPYFHLVPCKILRHEELKANQMPRNSLVSELVPSDSCVNGSKASQKAQHK